MAKYQSKHGIDVAEGAEPGEKVGVPKLWPHEKRQRRVTLCKAPAGAHAHMKLD